MLRYTMRKHTGFAHTLVLERMTTKVPTSLAYTTHPYACTKQSRIKPNLSHTQTLSPIHTHRGRYLQEFIFLNFKKIKNVVCSKNDFCYSWLVAGILIRYVLDLLINGWQTF